MLDLEVINRIINTYDTFDFNEANTRFKIIDEIFMNVFQWPKTLLSCEDSIEDTGYSDYILKKNNSAYYLVIEAKKEGISFNVPGRCNKSEYSFIAVEALMTDKCIKAAMLQARTYCMEIGCDFACITNGHVWIFFKCFESNKNWRKLKAFVIPSLHCFRDNFTYIYNMLSFDAIKAGSLNRNIGITKKGKRELFFPKKNIRAYDEKIDANNYSKFFRPITNRYFKDLDVEDVAFIENCYVEDRSLTKSQDELHNIIIDAIPPYFIEDGVVDAEGEDGNIKFINRLHKHNQNSSDKGDVIVLFGGKGAGKSTFLKTTVFHKPPQILSKACKVVIVDLLKTPEDKDSVKNTIWSRLIRGLDEFKILDKSRDDLLNLYKKNFDIRVC